VQKFGVPAVVCVNKFPTDTAEEVQALKSGAEALGAICVVGDHWANGGAGAEDLAKAVLDTLEKPSSFKPLYSEDLPIDEKIRTIATQLYGAEDVHFSEEARTQLKALGKNERAMKFPVCIAKTQYSFSEDPKKVNAPTGHTLTVRELRLCNGAEFIVAVTGSIMTMPGLPKVPSSEHISVKDGRIVGLF